MFLDFFFNIWSYLHNYEFANGGWIWICWDPNEVKVDILGSSDQIAHVGVFIVGTNSIFNAFIIYKDNRPSK
jgi:hypothetical protein